MSPAQAVPCPKRSSCGPGVVRHLLLLPVPGQGHAVAPPVRPAGASRRCRCRPRRPRTPAPVEPSNAHAASTSKGLRTGRSRSGANASDQAGPQASPPAAAGCSARTSRDHPDGEPALGGTGAADVGHEDGELGQVGVVLGRARRQPGPGPRPGRSRSRRRRRARRGAPGRRRRRPAAASTARAAWSANSDSRAMSSSAPGRAASRSSRVITPSSRVGGLHRDSEQCTGHVAGALGDVPGEPGVALQVVDGHRLAGGGHPAGHPAPGGQPHPGHVLGAGPGGGGVDQLGTRLRSAGPASRPAPRRAAAPSR